MSLYQDYCNERGHCSVIEHEWGFVSYAFPNPETVYLIDMYIIDNRRNRVNGVSLIRDVEEIGRKAGCKRIMVTIVPSTNASSYSLMISLKYGFKITGTQPDIIYLSKEL